MKILIAVDDSSHSRRAVEFAARMRWPPGSRMIVANVAPRAEAHAQADMESREPVLRRQQSLIAEAQKRLRDAGLSTEWHATEGDAREQLLRLVEEERVDLLVMGSRGCGALPRSTVGSVSSHAVAHASCSVLVVRKPQRRCVQPNRPDEESGAGSQEDGREDPDRGR